MYHRLHVRPQLVDFAVDEPFDHAAAAPRINRIGVKVVFHDVTRGYQNRCERPGHQIAVWITWMTDAHVSVSIEHALLGKDTVGRNKVLDERRIDSAARARGRLRGSKIDPDRENEGGGCDH
jgi:hypothetical protein